MFFTQVYNNAYIPAAPFATVDVYSPGQPERGMSIPCLLDSGADGTLLPKRLLTAIGARFLETRLMRGITGQRVKVRMYLVSMDIGGIVVNAISAAAIEDGEEAVPGRDVLNQLIVTLNGLGETVEIRDYI